MAWWNNFFARTDNSNPLGKQLLALYRSSIHSPSAEALRKLAQACDPSAEEWKLASETMIFHKFLLVQACAGHDDQNIINRAVSAFYAEMNELARTTPGANRDRLTLINSMWEERAKVYDQAFSLDWEEYMENRPGHLPWKRLITVYGALFGQKYDQESLFENYTSECVEASISIATTFANLFKNVGQLKRTYL